MELNDYTKDLINLRFAIFKGREDIMETWDRMSIDSDHYLSEALADLINRMDEVRDLVNQEIGEQI